MNLLVAAALSAACVSSAFAANSLAGPYVGAQAGFSQTSSTVEDSDCWWGCSAYTARKTGGVAGVQAGYNWVSDSLLTGVSLDYTFGGSNNELQYGNYYDGSAYQYGAMTAATKIKGTLSLRGKMGLVVGNTAVVASAGFARAKIDSTLTEDYIYSGSREFYQADASGNANGTVIGLAIEHTLTDKLSLGLELSQYSFKNLKGTFSNSGSYVYSINSYSSSTTATLALNYRF